MVFNRHQIGADNGMENRLKEWRNCRGLTQQKLAELADTSHQTIQRLERGIPPRNADDKKGMALTTQWMKRLAPYLDIQPYQLVCGSEVAPALSLAELKLIVKFRKLDTAGRAYVEDAISDALAARIEKKTPQEMAAQFRRDMPPREPVRDRPVAPSKTPTNTSKPSKVL